MQKETDGLKVMRGIAALMVSFFHVRQISWIGITQYWSNHGFDLSINSLLAYSTFPVTWGFIGVPVFFVISGYCIHYSYATKILKTPKREFNSSDFLKRRLIRIYPVLIGALFVTLLFDSLSMQIIPGNPKLGDIGIKSFFVNLFAMQGVLGGPYGSNSPLWTLAIEIQFYVVYPILILFRQTTSLTIVIVAIVAITIVSWNVFERNGIYIFTTYYTSWFAGAFIAELRSRNLTPISRLTRNCMLISSGLFLAAGCYLFKNESYFAFQLWSASFALLLWLSFEIKFSRWLFVFEWVGEFSYSLYIIHLPFFVLANAFLFNAVPHENIGWSILLLLSLIPFAYGFYCVFERPFAKYLARNRTKAMIPL